MDKAEQLAMLSLTLSLFDMAKKNFGRGRLKRHIQKLQARSSAIIHAHGPHWTSAVKTDARRIIETFGERSGWDGSDVRTVAYISFCVMLLESSPFKSFIEDCEKINDYFNRSGEDLFSDYEEAERAFLIWNTILLDK